MQNFTRSLFKREALLSYEGSPWISSGTASVHGSCQQQDDDPGTGSEEDGAQEQDEDGQPFWGRAFLMETITDLKDEVAVLKGERHRKKGPSSEAEMTSEKSFQMVKTPP